MIPIMRTLRRPHANESNDYFKRYINLVETEDVVAALKNQVTDVEHFLREWPSDKWNHTYAKGKWTGVSIVPFAWLQLLCSKI